VSQRRWWGIVLAALVLLGAGTANAALPYKIYRVGLAPGHAIQAVADLGLDILDVEPTYATVKMTVAEAQRVRDLGYRVTIEIDDVAAKLAEVESNWAPAAVAYHTYDSLRTDLYALEASGVAKVYVIGKSLEGRDILAVKISDNPSIDEPGEPEGVIFGCHHAREWISVEVPFYLAKALVDEYPTNSEVASIVNNGVTWIVPMTNPDGHEYTRLADRLWRKNRRHNSDGSYGVDLNRNYATGWGGSGSSGIPSSDTYHGTAAFSEPETQVARDFVLAHDFQYLLTYHSYSQLVLWPWGYTGAFAPDAAFLARFGHLLADMIDAVHGVDYFPEKSSDLYLAAGTTDDWFYDISRNLAFTVELRPTGSIPGFQLPPDQIIPTYEENRPAAFFLMKASQGADQDGDGVADLADNCPGAANPTQVDGDSDAIGDVCDNCPSAANADQTDSNDDGVGNACATGGCGVVAAESTAAESSLVWIAAVFVLVPGLRSRARRRR